MILKIVYTKYRTPFTVPNLACYKPAAAGNQQGRPTATLKAGEVEDNNISTKLRDGGEKPKGRKKPAPHSTDYPNRLNTGKTSLHVAEPPRRLTGSKLARRILNNADYQWLKMDDQSNQKQPATPRAGMG